MANMGLPIRLHWRVKWAVEVFELFQLTASMGWA